MSLGPIPLGDAPYATPWHSVGREQCENLFLEYSQSGSAKAAYYYLGIPGLRRIRAASSAAGSAPCRGSIRTSAGVAYFVNGRSFYSINSAGVATGIGALSTAAGPVRMAENGKQIILVDGLKGYIYDMLGGTFATITDEYFPGGATTGGTAPTHVQCINTYFLVNAPGTNLYYWSNPYYGNDDGNDYTNATANGYWTPLRTGTKIGRPDNVIGISQAQGYLWLFGRNSIEVHYDTGDSAGQQWVRYTNALIDLGCSAAGSIANWETQIFWLGADPTGTIGVFTNDGMTPKKVSVRGIEQMIEVMGDPSDCIGSVYTQAGHTFYLMWFPSAGQTMVYDVNTTKWHVRTHLNSATGRTEAWHGIYPIAAYGLNLFGDMSSDAIYAADMLYFQNDNPTGAGVNYIRAVKTVPIVFSNGVRVRHNGVQPMFQQGVGTITGLEPGTSTTDPMQAFGRYPKCVIAYSDDGGVRYSNELDAPLGALGETTTRTIIRRLGLSRNRVYRFTITDPVRRIFVGCMADLTLGDK